MPLLLTGKKFHNDLKTNGCLAIFAPLEGGYETRLLRRMRSKGFKTFITSARGLGAPEVFLSPPFQQLSLVYYLYCKSLLSSLIQIEKVLDLLITKVIYFYHFH